MKICIVFGHYKTKDSFNALIIDAFEDKLKKIGHVGKHMQKVRKSVRSIK